MSRQPLRWVGLAVALLALAVTGTARQGSPTFAIGPTIVAEGTSGFSTATFMVTVTNPNNSESRVYYLTSDGSATSNASAVDSAGGVTIPTFGAAAPYPKTIDVSGLPGTIEHLAVRLNQVSHTSPADLDVLVVGPGGQRVIVMSDIGSANDISNVSLTFQDGAPPPSPPLTTGTYAPTDFDPGDNLPAPAPSRPYSAELSVFNGTNPNGTWSIYVNDDQSADAGTVGSFSLIITTSGGGGDYLPSAGLLVFPPGTPALPVEVPIRGDTTVEPDEAFSVNLVAPFNAVIGTAQGIGTILNDDGAVPVQPPTGLYVASMTGNVVTFRWHPPLVGSTPTSYVLEGGTTPGSVQASLPTGSTAPTMTLSVPNGSYYARVHTMSGGDRSAASNEILIHVNTPMPPSAPANLLGIVATSRLGLAWRNTFEGGAPTSAILDVSGPITTSVPLGLVDTFQYASVPAGTYTFSVRTMNPAGSSASSNPVTLTFPGGCGGLLQPPSNVLAFKAGNVITIVWEPPTLGPAPTGYVLNVGGSFVGSIPTGARALSGAVGPGTYTLSLQSTNFCGSGVPSPIQTIVVP